jgi:hypothetical protein
MENNGILIVDRAAQGTLSISNRFKTSLRGAGALCPGRFPAAVTGKPV